jgi:hypothetical protein
LCIAAGLAATWHGSSSLLSHSSAGTFSSERLATVFSAALLATGLVFVLIGLGLLGKTRS